MLQKIPIISKNGLTRIKFPTKNSGEAYHYLPLRVELESSKDVLCLKYYNTLENFYKILQKNFNKALRKQS